LRNNKIQASASAYLADLIKSNKAIKRLDLRWNDLTRQGAQNIVLALQSNSIIHYLDLAGNKGVEEIQTIIESYL